VVIWIISIVPQLIIALVLALILNEKFIKGRHFFRAVFYLPNIVTPVTIGVLADLMFDWQTGFVNKLLMALHIIKQPVYWFGHPFLAQLIVGGVICWQYFGYNMLIFIAGLQSIDSELYEAAEIDGAGKFQTAIRISLPLLKPVMMFTIITSIIGGIQIFDIPMMVGNAVGNATQTLIVYLYKAGFVNFDYGYAAAIAYATFVIIIILTLISLKVSNRKSAS
jgi:ABC-type sugar transport system permease subunit